MNLRPAGYVLERGPCRALSEQGRKGVIVVPELDLVVATYGGNYSDRVGLRMQQDYVPSFILPAVRETGDDPKTPVIQRDFETPYG